MSREQKDEDISRFRGCLLGLTIGDAIGTTLEFQAPGSFDPLTDMVGGGPFRLMKGEWTDDSSMALCLAESLIECGEHNPEDQCNRYLDWYRHAHLSSNGVCFDIGMTTVTSLLRFETSKNPISGLCGELSAGNGSLMRLAPIPMFYHKTPETAVKMCCESSKTTHGTKTCIDSVAYYGALIVGALRGELKEKLLEPYYTSNVLPENFWEQYGDIHPEVDEIVQGSYKRKSPPDINGKGYVVRSMEAALWAFHNSESFQEGCLKVVNLGDDADTTGAIYGMLAGAYYGVGGTDGIPEKWSNTVVLSSLIRCFADELEHMAPEDETKSDVDPSEKYVLCQKVYGQLEKGYRKVARRLLPCPTMYRKLETFDVDRGKLFDAHEELVHKLGNDENEKLVKSLKTDFEKRLNFKRIVVERRAGRVNIGKHVKENVDEVGGLE